MTIQSPHQPPSTPQNQGSPEKAKIVSGERRGPLREVALFWSRGSRGLCRIFVLLLAAYLLDPFARSGDAISCGEIYVGI